MLLPKHRALIEEQFGGPVYDYYGGRELGPIAGESHAHEGLHVFCDISYVEIIRPDGTPCGPGEVGEILITKLHEHAMPFIRYRTGDRAAWLPGEDSSGLGLPRLSSIEGRVGDFILAPDGREIHGEYFTHLFYGVKGVTRFQVRQPTPQTLRILVQTTGETDPTELERIRSASSEHFCSRNRADVVLELVDDIPTGPSGKHRFIIPYEDS